MKHHIAQSGTSGPPMGSFIALLCVLLLIAPGNAMSWPQPAQAPQPSQTAAAPAQEAPEAKLPPEQLDSLVAPIALYPDPLLSQTLVACTYPLEIIQLQQWLAQHKDLKDKALADAVQKENWDPSIQSMAALPDVVKQLAENIKWTDDLGNAFLAQQDDVMAAVQRMRKKAMDAGNLKSTEQQKVETKVVETQTVIVVEQANPQVVYVPSYNPVVVYGPPVYPYPPIYYPPVGYYAAGMAISFGVGVAMGAMWGGGWGYGCGWGGGGNNVYINNSNNFVNRNNNINNINRSGNRTNTGNSNWQHSPQHRGGAPYSNKATANQYGGNARGDSASTRQSNARQNQGQGGNRAQAGTMDRGGSNVSPRAGDMSSSRSGSGGGDRVGNRSVPNSPSASDRSSFGGASRGTSGSQAKASSSRGASSMSSSRGGGGGSRGGGGGGRRR